MKDDEENTGAEVDGLGERRIVRGYMADLEAAERRRVRAAMAEHDRQREANARARAKRKAGQAKRRRGE